MTKRLLLISNKSAHTFNYINLIQDYFDSVFLITNIKSQDYSGECIAVNFSLRSPLTILSTIKAIRQAYRKFKPDIIHVHQANTCALFTLLALRKFHVPIILTAYGSDILSTPKENLFYRMMIKYNLNRSDYFTSDSLFMASVMRNLVKKKNMEIVLANFGIQVKNSVLPKENIIFSNRLHKSLYRVAEIIQSFSKFYQLHRADNWKLIVAGEGEETDNLKLLANRLNLSNQVEFVGWLDMNKNIDYYQRARIYVTIPYSDATSISLLESMYYGCIPVVSNLPANGEWILDGLNGVIVENVNDPFLERALSIDVEKLTSLNKFLIQEKALPEVSKQKYVGLYSQIYATLRK